MPGAVIAFFFVTALASELTGATFGFGPAILYQVCWQVGLVVGLLTDDNLNSTVGDFVVLESLCGVVQLAVLRRHFRPKLSMLFSMPMMLAMAPGMMLLDKFGNLASAKRLPAIAFLAIAAIQGYRMRFSAACTYGDLEHASKATVMCIVVAASCSGFLRGLAGIAGPPIMVLLMFFSVDQNVWRCTASVMRVTMIFVQGAFFGYNGTYKWSYTYQYLALMTGGLVGLCLGNRLAKHINKDAFQLWLMIFLSSAAVLMLCAGNQQLSEIASVAVGTVAMLTALVPLNGLSRSIVSRREQLAPNGDEDTLTVELRGSDDETRLSTVVGSSGPPP